MSIAVVSAIWKTCLYQGNTLNVLLAMGDWAEDDGGDIFPGVELLAAKARASVRTTQIALRQLEDDEVIERIANPSGGRGKITEYKIDLERVQELHGFHEAENPGCEHCEAKRKSAQKRVQYRAQRVQKSVGKGAEKDRKGADSCAHIDNTRQQPSNTPLSPTDVGESENLGSLSKDGSNHWQEFRSAVAETWPDGFPATDEAPARRQFERCCLRISPGSLVGCTRMHGAAETARKAARRGQGVFLTKLPSNWLKENRWEGYVSQLSADSARADQDATVLAEVKKALGTGIYAILRRVGVSEAELLRMAGVRYEPGPPPALVTTSEFQAHLLRTRSARLDQELGKDLVITTVSQRKSA